MSNNPAQSKKRILLLQPPFEDFYSTPIRLYPLGLLYVAAVLESQGHSVQILDCLNPLKKATIEIPACFSGLKEYLPNPYFFNAYYRFGYSDQEILRHVLDYHPDVVGISSECTAYYKNVGEIATLIKQNLDRPIILGGNHASVFSDEIRRRTPVIDFIHRGPAEKGLLSGMVDAGILAAPAPVDIDWRFLRPAHHLLDSGRYRIRKMHYASLIASRGCPYRCDFCSVHNMFGRKITYRTVDAVLQEMRWLHQARHVRIFNFEDDNLTYDRVWFLHLISSIRDDLVLQDIELTAMNGVCHDTLDEETLQAMRQAGFRRLNLSLITQSSKLRNQYNRPGQSDNLEDILRLAQKLDFFVTVYVIIGLPGQQYHEVKESIDYLLHQDVLVGPSVFYLPPASALYEKLHLSPSVRENWNLYRSSAFALETEHLSRNQLIELFIYARKDDDRDRMLPVVALLMDQDDGECCAAEKGDGICVDQRILICRLHSKRKCLLYFL